MDADEQIDQLTARIDALREMPAHDGQQQALRHAEAHLANLVSKQGRGELEPVWTDETEPV